MDSLLTTNALLGAPILAMFGWMHVQVRSIKDEVEKKVSGARLEREAATLKEIVEIKDEHINSRLDDLFSRIDKMEDKIDRVIQLTVKPR